MDNKNNIQPFLETNNNILENINEYIIIENDNIKNIKSNLILKTSHEYQEQIENEELNEYKNKVNKTLNYYNIIYDKLQEDISKTQIKINNIENKILNKNSKLKTLSVRFNLYNNKNHKNYKYLIKSIEHNQQGIRLLITYIIIGLVIIIICNY